MSWHDAGEIATASVEFSEDLPRTDRQLLSKIILFMDCRLLLEGLQNTWNKQQLQVIKKARGLGRKTRGERNQMATLRFQTPLPLASLSEGPTKRPKLAFTNWHSSKWERELDVDPIHPLLKHQQTTIFWLKTGHYSNTGHYSILRCVALKISHMEKCP